MNGGDIMLITIIMTICLFFSGYCIASYFRRKSKKDIDDDLFIYLIIASTVLVYIALQGADLLCSIIFKLF